MDQAVKDQIELLKKYYPLDEKRKVFDIVLHYEKASELFDTDVESITPKMKDEIVRKVVDIVEDIPHGYKADISLVIDDYEAYDKKVVLDSFNDLLFLTKYRFNKENKAKWFKVGILILTGIMLIFIKSLLAVNNFWGMLDNSEVSQSVILIVTEISGWVFIWESVSLLFLRGSDFLRYGKLMLSKIANIELYKGNVEKALAKESSKDIATSMLSNDLGRRVGSILLLFAVFAIIGVGFATLITSITSFNPTSNYAVFELIFDCIVVAIKFLTGFAAVKLYIGKEKYKVPVIVVASIDFVFIVLGIVGLFINGLTVKNLILLITSSLVNSAYVIGVILYLVGDFRQKMKEKK
jgi:hypothetical protein